MPLLRVLGVGLLALALVLTVAAPGSGAAGGVPAIARGGLSSAGTSAPPRSLAIQALDTGQVRTLQNELRRLGLPTGPVDGQLGPKTRRALCAWRELTGRGGRRGAATPADLKAVAATARLVPRGWMVTGLNVSRTCQTMTWVVNSQSIRRVRAVFPVSTGKAATKTRRGTFRIFRSQDRWANSLEFPSSRPNMYRPVYFSGGQAFHGMQADHMVFDRPASHGCVRMLHKDIDRLWASGATRRRTLVKVYGDW